MPKTEGKICDGAREAVPAAHKTESDMETARETGGADSFWSILKWFPLFISSSFSMKDHH